jgi:hypothetical protein
MEQEILTNRFLRTLRKTQAKWESDKQFTKIIRKMEKGKNLKRKEFDKVYFLLQERGKYYH